MIKLKKIQLKDCKFVNTLRNECVDFLHDSRIFTIKQTIKWFKSLKIPYYIIWNETKRVGYIRLSNLENRSIYIGCDIVSNQRRKGIAYTALSMIIPKVFKDYPIDSIIAEVLEFNIPSFNLYKKLGFSMKMIKKNNISKNNKFVDSIVLTLTKK